MTSASSDATPAQAVKPGRIFIRFLLSPMTVVAFILAGIACGIYAPALAKTLSPIGDTYLNLLKMIVLPFIVSSIIFSMRSMVKDPQSSSYLPKIAASLVVTSIMAVAVSGSLTLIFKPGEIVDPQARIELGKVINGQGQVSTDLQMTLAPGLGGVAAPNPFASVLDLVPSNVFSALSSGDTIKVLLFCLLFGLAVGRVPHTVSTSLADGLDAVYRACIIMTGWFNVLLPFASFAMIANQTASLGLEPLRLMVGFLLVMGLSCVIFIVVSLSIVSIRSGVSYWVVCKVGQPLFMMAIATKSSVAAIPWVISLLAEQLKFNRVAVELLVPLQTALLRTGPIMLFACGTIFIAQLYGRTLSVGDLGLIGVSSILLGLTTAGMSGIVTLSQMAVICGYLRLPFEAAFILFVAVDAVADTFRTLTIVATVTAATSVIAPRKNGTSEDDSMPQLQELRGTAA